MDSPLHYSEATCGILFEMLPHFPLDDSEIHSTMKPPRTIHQAEYVSPVFQQVVHYWSELFCMRWILVISLLTCGCSDREQAKELMKRRRSEQLRRLAEQASASEVEMLAMQLTDLIIAEKGKRRGLGMWQNRLHSYLRFP